MKRWALGLGLATAGVAVAMVAAASTDDLKYQRRVGYVTVVKIDDNNWQVTKHTPAHAKYPGGSRVGKVEYAFPGRPAHKACLAVEPSMIIRAKARRGSLTSFFKSVWVSYEVTCEQYSRSGIQRRASMRHENWAPLVRYWNSGRKDNYSGARPWDRTNAESAKYRPVLIEAVVHKSGMAGKTRALKLYYHDKRRDHATVAHHASIAKVRAEGYRLVGTVGHVFINKQPGMVPLHLQYRSSRKDYWTTVTPKHKNYKWQRVEGWVKLPTKR